MTLTIEQAIAESRRIEEAATPGPWWAEGGFSVENSHAIIADCKPQLADVFDDGQVEATAAFIAQARNTYRLLLDVAEAYDSLRRIRKLGVACEADYENVDAALQAFAAYMSGETK